MTLDPSALDRLRGWIGRSQLWEDVVTLAPLAGLAAVLDHAAPPWRAGEAPPLGHWLYFLDPALQRDIDGDGHPRRGGFLPPVALPRRMWAGASLKFASPLRAGDAIRRKSTIEAITPKEGRSGQMVFVKVRHEISTAAGPAVTEFHDIVYREAAAPPNETTQPSDTQASEPPPSGAVWQRQITPDPVLLFRFSALTFNGHRIHYDRDYCRTIEGYPGLVCHGPLSATLLMDLFLRHNPGARVTGFRFRAKRPVFDIHPLSLCGRPTPDGASLWLADHQGMLAVAAELEAQ